MLIDKGIIQAIFFDLDDTLTVRRKSIESYFIWLINNYCTNVANIEGELDALLRMDDNGNTKKQDFYENLLYRWNIDSLSRDDFIVIWKEEFYKHVVARDNLYKVLEYLSSKYKLAIITNGYEEVQRKKIRMLQIEKFFSYIFVSETEGYSKPSSQIFINACELLGCDKRKTVFIGDHIENDIYGAYNAGLIPIWLNCGEENVNLNLTKISDLRELLTIF